MRRGPCRKRRRNRGAGLLELIVATVVLSTVLLGIISLSGTAITGNTRSQNVNAALRLASDKMERLRALRFGSLSSGSDLDALTTGGDPGGVYSRSWVVSPRTIRGVDVKDVAVTVTWPGGGQISLSFLATNPGSGMPPLLEFFPSVLVQGWEQVR